MSQLKKYLDRKGNSVAHLYVDAKSGIFWAVIRVGKQIRKKPLKTKDYVTALGKLPTALVDLGSLEAKKKAPAKLCSDYWLDLRKEKVSEEIKEATLIRVDSIWRNNIEPFIGCLRPEDIHPAMMPAFMEWHRKKRPGKQFINTFKYLGNLFRYMHRVGAIKIEQIPRITLPKKEVIHHDKVKTRIITLAQKDAIVAKAKLPRTKLLIENDYILGMRKMELAEIKKSQITKEEGRYFYNLDADDTKTGLARIIPVPVQVVPLLEAQIEASGHSEYLFPQDNGLRPIASQTIDKDWFGAKSDAKIVGKMRFHDLRGTAATNMAIAKINPIIACTILGMSFSTYQKKYLKLSGKDLMMDVDQLSKREIE